MKENRTLILSLIKDNLVHAKLILALENAGLISDCYGLHLSETIFELMGIEDTPETEYIFIEYLKLVAKVRKFRIEAQRNKLDSLVEEIYSYLIVAKLTFAENGGY